ncbi:hypothetical protein GGD50_004609 [Rhizobium paranaense]|uniref:Uncharacterized protein n=1 Tax=Rhizobium paranaense TaxID=1650438 RepID=A0A7W9D314_9HYPH|nr:hypothetical protein [Rhizobium paranaense]
MQQVIGFKLNFSRPKPVPFFTSLPLHWLLPPTLSKEGLQTS